jgi:exodeoxyribonuclease VII large subunit
MVYLVKNQLKEGSRRLETIRGRYGFQRPADLLLTFGQRIDELSERIARSENSLLEKFRKTWESLGRHLSGFSPLAVLDRGYSITLTHPEGKVVKNAESVVLHQEIVTRLAKGRLISRITEKEKGEKE